MTRASKEIIACWLIAALLVAAIAVLEPGERSVAARREIAGPVRPPAGPVDTAHASDPDRETLWIDEQFDAHDRQAGAQGLDAQCCPDDQPREVAR